LSITTQNLSHPLFKLILFGLITQIIYVTYIVAFPLIANTQAGGPAADLEILMRDYRWFAPVYALGILLLYYLFWQTMRIVSAVRTQESDDTFHNPHLKLLILGFGLLFGFTLVWLYPISANDLFRYVVRGRIWAIYGESPMLVPPNAFPEDPYIAFAGEYGDLVSGYGPLWQIVVQIPLRLGAQEMVSGAIGLKFVALFCYLICAILIGWGATGSRGSLLAALAFFAWNPLILMQGLGNGHNDMVFITLLVLGIIAWQRRLWWITTVALTMATLAKAPAAMMFPLFIVVLLRNEPSWQRRILKIGGVALFSLITVYLAYSVLGPISETVQSLSDTMSLSRRGGFSIAANLRLVLREIISPEVAEVLPRTTGRYIYYIFYAWLLLQLWRKKLTLVTAGFLAYFSQLMLWRTFRIWYPMWLVPLAALHLTPATFWRTFLFGLTAELSIINYFVAWRWKLRDLPWEKLGLSTTLYYWPVMHTLTVPWLFGIPLFGPIVMKWWQKKKRSTV